MNNDKTDSVEVGKTWEKLFSLVKRITGDVKVSSQGTLQGQIDATNTKVDECFQNVSDGKTLVANAISDKGVATAADAKFATMATNISKIKTNPALQAKTVTLDTSKTSATLAPDAGYDGLSQVKASITPQTKSVNLSTSQQVVKPDSGKVLSQVTVPAVTGTAALKDVVAGKTFNSATSGVGKTGTLPDKRGTTVDAAAVEQDDDYTYFTVPTEAAYDAKSKIRTMSSNLGNINLAKFIGVSVYVGSGGDGLYKYTYDVEKCGKIKLEKSSFPDCALAWAHGKNDNSLTSVTFYKADGTTKISDLAMTVDETYSVPSEAKYAVLASSRWGGSSARNSYTYIQSV